MKKPVSDPDRPCPKIYPGLSRSIAIPLFLGMAVFFSCRKNDIEVIRSLTDVGQLPNQTARNIQTVYTDSARTQLIIQATVLKRFENENNPYLEFPDGIYVEFYGKDEQIDSRLSAKYAIYFENDELWEARDSVVAINRFGEVLNSNLLFWDEKKKLIYTSQSVQITTTDELIFGEGFEANQDFSDWKIKKVTGTIYFEE